MFDLESISPIADAIVTQDFATIKISFAVRASEPIVQSLIALRTKGIDLYGDEHWRQGKNKDFMLIARTYDHTQLAERIASGLEGQGLSVSRVTARGKTVQSFVLA